MHTPTLHAPALHVAIIMDGNGRWATRRGLPRVAGHRAGLRAARRIVAAAPALGVTNLTLYGFSADNWKRPTAEVDLLMSLFLRYLRLEGARLRAEGVRVSVIGRRDRLPEALVEEIHRAEQATASGSRIHLRLALDYSSREAIRRDAHRLARIGVAGEAPSRASAAREDVPDVDLMIRSGGEKRLSDFLLWESAYAELWFTDMMWPDFGPDQLRLALDEFHGRERRYGGLPAEAAAEHSGTVPALQRAVG